MLNNIIKHPNLGITTSFTNANLEKVNHVLPQAVDEFVRRANQKGQFLNWVDLPKHQQERIDELVKLNDEAMARVNDYKLTISNIDTSI